MARGPKKKAEDQCADGRTSMRWRLPERTVKLVRIEAAMTGRDQWEVVNEAILHYARTMKTPERSPVPA